MVQVTSETQRSAAAVWRQTTLPVLFDDRAQKRLLVKLPYAQDNGPWLRTVGGHRRPVWHKTWRCWQVPKAWLEALAALCAQRYGAVYVIHPYRERETCAPACWNAEGVECLCSCLGANHGQGDQGRAWYIVAETCAVAWGPRQYACRLLRHKADRKELSNV